MKDGGRADGQPDVDDLIDEAARQGFESEDSSLRLRAGEDASLASELEILRSLHAMGETPAPTRAAVDRSVGRAMATLGGAGVDDVDRAPLVADDEGPTAPTIRLSERPAAPIGRAPWSRSAPVLSGLAGLAAGVLVTVAVERWIVPAPPAQVVRVFDAQPRGEPMDDGDRLLAAAQEAERSGNPGEARRLYRQLADAAPSTIAGWARLEAARLALDDLDDPAGALEDVDGIPDEARPRWRLFVDAITERARAELSESAR